jgi:competence ComEA-like helix-hairpin-helix protein
MRLPGIDGWTPRERKAAGALAATWLAGVLAGWTGLDRALAGAADTVLHPPRPTVAELAERVGPGDPRPAWYAAALALREEEAVASSGPRMIDPNAAGRAEWDRLPGVGPVTAIAIVQRRESAGPFRGPGDLLAVRGIGPRTLERLAPYLDWGAAAPATGRTYSNLTSTSSLPDINRVDEAFLRALPGFGPELATQVIRERQARGAFRDWTELLSVKGIGPARLEILQKATRLGGSLAAGDAERQGREWTP